MTMGRRVTTLTDQPSLDSDIARYRPTNPEPPNRIACLVLVNDIVQLDDFSILSLFGNVTI